jgi:hypothetical protein
MITQERSLWHAVASTRSQHFSLPDLPDTNQNPASVTDDISSTELEQAVRRSFLSAKAFTAQDPQATSSTTLLVTDGPLSRVVNMHFIAMGTKDYLVTANTLGPWPGVRSIECWDINGHTDGVLVARYHHSSNDGRLRYVVNSEWKGQEMALLAVSIDSSNE